MCSKTNETQETCEWTLAFKNLDTSVTYNTECGSYVWAQGHNRGSSICPCCLKKIELVEEK